MTREFTLSQSQVEDAIAEYMKECILRDGLRHTYKFNFKHEVESGKIGTTLNVVVKVEDVIIKRYK